MTHKCDTVLAGKFPACEFPSANLTSALLKAGADPMATDDDGNTALHLTATSHPWRIDIAEILLRAGAHIDAVNSDNQTYEMIQAKKHRFDVLNPLKYTTLACLAARVVARTQRIDRVPKHLQDFVLMH